MLNRKLSVGDYVFDVRGNIAKVVAVNLKSYRIQVFYGYDQTIGFDGKEWGSYENNEWFYCDDVEGKAFESAIKHRREYLNFREKAMKLERYFGQVKYLLNCVIDNQLKDIKAIYTEDVEELENYDDE